MRLRTRLTMAVVTVSSLGGLVIGGLAVSEARNAGFASIDRTLLAVTAQVAATPKDPVAAGILAVDRSPSALALGFHAKGAAFTWLRELPGEPLPTPSDAAIASALTSTREFETGFHIASVELPDGAVLVVVASTAEVTRRTGTDIAWMVGLWLVLSLLTGFLIRVLVGRDTRDIERLVTLAGEVAHGADVHDLPERPRSAEVAALAEALRHVVASLRSAVTVEQAANQRMQAFLGDASHELRTPLTVIKGYLELLERDVEPDQRDRAMARMRAEAARMEMLVNDLLLLAEIGTPAPDRVETVDVSAVVRVLAEDLRALQPERPVTANLADGITTRAVPEHVRRAIANGFANVRRHTAATDPVRVTLRSDGVFGTLVLEDGGPGLPAETYAHGITHFHRFDRSRSRATGGSGLGMSIISAVMAEAGGQVVLGPSELGGLRLEYRFPMGAALPR